MKKVIVLIILVFFFALGFMIVSDNIIVYKAKYQLTKRYGDLLSITDKIVKTNDLKDRNKYLKNAINDKNKFLEYRSEKEYSQYVASYLISYILLGNYQGHENEFNKYFPKINDVQSFGKMYLYYLNYLSENEFSDSDLKEMLKSFENENIEPEKNVRYFVVQMLRIRIYEKLGDNIKADEVQRELYALYGKN